MENYTGNVKITTLIFTNIVSKALGCTHLPEGGKSIQWTASRSISLRNVMTRFPVDNISMSILNDKTK